MLGIVVFSTKNFTFNNFVNFKKFLRKFCVVIAKLFCIIFCKFCLNQLRFSYFIMKRVELQFFFSDTSHFTYIAQRQHINTTIAV